MRWLILLALGLALGTWSCGPMNAEKKTSAQTSTSAFRAVNSSKNNVFLVYSTLQSSGDETTRSTDGSPQVGDNVFLIRCVHAEDLHGISAPATVTVTYWMPSMPEMGKSEATATRQADGTYSVTLFFSMTGLWEMTLSLQDGNKQDEYVFETKF